MNVKRFLSFGVLGLFLISMIGVVLGADLTEEGREVGEGLSTLIGGFFEPLLSPLFGDTELLSRVFFAVLLGMIIYSIVGTMFKESQNWIKWGITGAITSLALLGLPSSFLEAIRIQYGAMGAAILTIIPFIIILIFSLKSGSVLIARMTWIFYAVYYFTMYLYGIATSKTGWFSFETAPYLIAFFAGIFIFFGMPTIRNLIFKGELAGLEERGMGKVKRRKLLQEIQDEDLGRYAD
jgi:hypothetical protein